MWQKTIWQKYMNGRNCLMYNYKEMDSKRCFIHFTKGIDNNKSMCKRSNKIEMDNAYAFFKTN